MATRIRRRQRAVKGGREPLPASVEQHIWGAADRRAKKFNCSRSWVTAQALAEHLGIDLQPFERYDYQLTVVRRKAS